MKTILRLTLILNILAQQTHCGIVWVRRAADLLKVNAAKILFFNTIQFVRINRVIFVTEKFSLLFNYLETPGIHLLPF